MKNLLLPALAAGLLALSAAPPALRRPPNIIFILADDMGIQDLSCYGSDQYKTPALDALAAGGLRFEVCYSTPLCGPSRCQLMTGRYPFRTGATTNQTAENPTPDREIVIAKVLRQAGYVTGQAGKWHQMGGLPGDWGFDESVTDAAKGGHSWVKSYLRNGKEVKVDHEVHIQDVLQDFAVDFVTRHREEPFFFYYATHLVHSPIVRTPDSAPDSKDLYADNIVYLDKMVGKLIADLDRLGLREQTLVLFTGDNGTAGKHGTIHGHPLHGEKGSMMEGGSRVPLIASWKGTTPEGKVNKDLIDFSDMFPTFVELAGAALPEGVKIDGRSFAPALRGMPGTPRDWIFVQLGNEWYARDARYKLTQKGDLFDLRRAPFRETPVPRDSPSEEVQASRRHLTEVLDRLAAEGLSAERR